MPWDSCSPLACSRDRGALGVCEAPPPHSECLALATFREPRGYSRNRKCQGLCWDLSAQHFQVPRSTLDTRHSASRLTLRSACGAAPPCPPQQLLWDPQRWGVREHQGNGCGDPPPTLAKGKTVSHAVHACYLISASEGTCEDSSILEKRKGP